MSDSLPCGCSEAGPCEKHGPTKVAVTRAGGAWIYHPADWGSELRQSIRQNLAEAHLSVDPREMDIIISVVCSPASHPLQDKPPAAREPERIVCEACEGVGCGACNEGYIYFEAAPPPADETLPAGEALATWMILMGFSTGHGDTVADLLNELKWQIHDLRMKIALNQPSGAQGEGRNWKGVKWRDSIRASNLAEEIALHFAHDCHDSMCTEDSDASNCEAAWVEDELSEWLDEMAAPDSRLTTLLTGLRGLRELSAKATSGKWTQESTYFSAYVPGGRPNGEIIGSAHPTVSGIPEWLPKDQQRDNAAFIVACVNFVRDTLVRTVED